MNNVDNRVVQMGFENERFEKGVKESVKSLEKLKEGLKLEDSAKSLENLQKAGEHFTLAKIAEGVDSLTNRFSAFGIMGMRVLENLTDKAMAFVGKLTGGLKDLSIGQIDPGFGKYEDKTRAVQTIMSATGESMETIDEQLAKLNWFTDETSYNFVDMVGNIGKFTSVGVKLEPAVTAMQGIATWAADSGAGISEASRAMYNLSQAMGAGAVKKIDWKSIENANMATAKFKKNVIGTAIALGKLDKSGKTKDGTLVTVQNFAETLQKGWFDKDVLVKVLERYGSFADEVYAYTEKYGVSASEAIEALSGQFEQFSEEAFKSAQEAKTFTDAIDATRDAVSSGFMTMFENIFGNYEEAKVIWTKLANDMWEIFAGPLEGVNELLHEWRGYREVVDNITGEPTGEEKYNRMLDGRIYLVNGLSDAFDGLLNVISAVKEIFADIFPQTTADQLLEFSKRVESLGKQFKTITGGFQTSTGHFTEEVRKIRVNPLEDFDKELKLGAKGEGVKVLQERLMKLGYDLGELGADGVFGPTTQAALKKFQKDYHLAVTGVYDEVTHTNLGHRVGLIPYIDEVHEKVLDIGHGDFSQFATFKKILEGVFTAGRMGLTVVKDLWTTFNHILSVFEPLAPTALTLAEALSRLMIAIENRFSSSTKFQEWLAKLDTFLDPIRDKIQSLCTSLLEFLGISGRLDEIDYDAAIDTILEKLDPLIRMGRAIGNLLSSTIKLVKTVGSFVWQAAKKIGDALSPIWDMLKKIFSAGFELLVEIVNRIAGFENTIGGSSKFQEWLAKLDEILPSVKEKISSFCDTVLEFLGLSGDISKLDFSKVLDNAIESIKNFFSDKVLGLFKGPAIDGEAISNIVDEQSIIETIKEKVISIFNSIKNWVSGLLGGANGEGAVLPKLNFDGYQLAIAGITTIMAIISGQLIMLIGTGLKIGRDISGIVNNVKKFTKKATDAVKTFKKNKKIEELGNIAEAIMKFAIAIGILVAAVYVLSRLSWDELAVGLVGLAGILALIVGSIFALKKVSSGFKNIDGVMKAVDMLALAVLGLGITALMLSKLSWDELERGLLGMLAILVLAIGTILILSKTNVPIQNVSGVIGIMGTLAVSLGAMADVVRKLGLMDEKTLKTGFISLAAMLALLGLFITAMGKVKVGAATVGAILAVAVSISLLIGGFLLLSFAMKLLNKDDLIKAFATLGAIVIGLGLALKLMNKINPSTRAILALLPIAVALDMLIIGFAGMALIMKYCSKDEILKAMAGIAALIVGSALLMKLIEKQNPSVGAILALLPIAIALDLLIVGFGALVFIMKKTSKNDMLKAFAAIGVIILSIGVITKILSSKKPPKIGAILALIPVALAIDIAIAGFILLALSVKNMDGENIKKAILAFISIVGMMSIMSVALSKASPGLKGSISMLISSIALIGAMVAFSLVLKTIKDVNTKKILSFALGLSAIMLAFGGLAVMSKIAGPEGILLGALAIVAVGVAIGALIAAFAGLSQIPGFREFMNSGATSIGEIIGTIVEQIEAAKFKGMAKGMQALSSSSVDVDQAALDRMMNAANAFADFNNNLPDYPAVNKLIPWAKTKMDLTMSDMETFANGMVAFVDGMSKFDASNFDTSNYETAKEMVSSFASFNEGLPDYSIPDKIIKWVTGETKLSLTLEDMNTFALGVSCFVQGMKNFDVNEFDPSSYETAKEMVSSFASFNEGLPDYSIPDKIIKWVTGETKLSLTLEDMNTFAFGVSYFVQGMKNFDISEFDPSSYETAKEMVSSFASFNDGLPDYSVPDKLIKWITGETNLSLTLEDMNTFALGVSYFVQGMKNFDVNEFDPSSYETAKEMVSSFASFNEGLPDYSVPDKIIKWVTGETKLSLTLEDMNTFALGISNFAQGMKKFDANEFDASSYETAKEMVSSFASFNEGLPDYSVPDKIIKWVTGETKLSITLEDMNAFALGMAYFIQGINSFGVDEYDVDKVNTAQQMVSSFATFNRKLPSYSTSEKLLKWITGDTKLSTLMSDMGSFADGINLFTSAMGQIDTSDEIQAKSTAAISIAQQVAEFISGLSDLNIASKSDLQAFFSGEDAQTTVFDSIVVLADSMLTAKEKMGELSNGTFLSDFNVGIEAITTLARFLDLIQSEKLFVPDQYIGDEFLNLTNWIDDIVEMIKTFGDKVSEINNLGEVSKLTYSFASLIEMIVGSGPTATITTDNFLGGVIQTARDAMGQLEKMIPDFTTVGENIANGLATGISNGSGNVITTAAKVAAAAFVAACKVLGVQSPSKEFAWIGEMSDEGLAKGLIQNSGMTEKASETVTNGMLETAQGSLASLSSLLAEGIDDQPVIRPIVDLTGAQDAANSIGSFFGDRSFGVTSNVMAKRTEMSGDGNPVTIQNGTVQATMAADAMNNQMRTLNESINSLKESGIAADQMQSLTERFGDLAEAVSNMKIVLDTGVLVGSIGPQMDSQLGVISMRRGRGN